MILRFMLKKYSTSNNLLQSPASSGQAAKSTRICETPLSQLIQQPFNNIT